MGQYVVKEELIDGTVHEVEYCNYSEPQLYGVQRAIAFRRTMEAVRDSFR